MTYAIEKIEGIGAVFAAKLAPAGIRTTADLLTHCATPKGRQATAKATGLHEKQLLKWTNLADLMRISGIGEEWSELLEAAGVDTVKELKTRVAAHLTERMATVNAERKLVRQLPSEKVVGGWIQQAATMEPVITY